MILSPAILIVVEVAAVKCLIGDILVEDTAGLGQSEKTSAIEGSIFLLARQRLYPLLDVICAATRRKSGVPG